jgi:L,D-transpeptidase ErfK/SrfK
MLCLSQLNKVCLCSMLGVALWLPAANAVMYRISPGSDIVGEVVQMKSGSRDTLLTIANQYGVGMHEMLESNPQLHRTQDNADQYLGRGKKVVIPTQYILPPYRQGIVINLPELRLYYFTPDGQYVYTYPVGLGRMEWRTPLAKTTVISKETDPIWTVPPSIHAYVLQETGTELPSRVMPGPDNPLGPYALRLGTSGYLIHGTNQPWSVGKYVSSGCIRLHNEDITELHQIVPVGAPVRLINYADKAGWAQGELYLQSRIPLEINAPAGGLNESSVQAVVGKAMAKRQGAVDWSKVEAVQSQRLGIPQPIGRGAPSLQVAEGYGNIDKSMGIPYNNPNNTAQIQLIGLYDDTASYNGQETVQIVTIRQEAPPHEVELN